MKEIVVFDTFIENGRKGPKRLFVYSNGKQIHTHTAENDWDVNRIKKNYESSFNESIRIRKGN